MTEVLCVLKYIGIGLLGIVWFYVAARMAARGVVRSIEEWKERKRHGEKEEN